MDTTAVLPAPGAVRAVGGRHPAQGGTVAAVLALCLLVFYGPMLLSAGSVVTSGDQDVVGHLLISLGDDRPGGRWFHYFDLSANARLWSNDVKYHPLHMIRLISVALGSGLAGWHTLIVGVHSVLFLLVYSYSRRILQVSAEAALVGAVVTFFAVSWYEWTALVYWTAGTVLLTISICEYWRFVTAGRRAHLWLCSLANALQAYVTQSQALIPTQVYLLGAVLLMAFHKRGAWRSTLSPLILFVWPLTVLGWTPILSPIIFAVGSGLVIRGGLAPMGWGLDLAPVTEFLGLLCAVPPAVSVLFDKLGWSHYALPPNRSLFSSFLFLPSLLALWRLGGHRRILVAGVAGYFVTVLLPACVLVPSPLLRDLGFWRLFALPALSGFVVAAAMDLRRPDGAETRATRGLHHLYGGLLVGALVGLVTLAVIGDQRLMALGVRQGLIGSGTEVAGLLRGANIFAAGIALGLAGYFILTARRAWAPDGWRSSALGSLALFVAIAAPTFGTGYGERWYERHPALGAALSPPEEFRFLRERIPGYEYRVGVVLASEMLLAAGDWEGFWTTSSQPNERVLSQLREHDLRLRQGLAFALPALHFYAPVHRGLQRDGNPFLHRWESREAPILNRRNVIVRPDAESFEDYGVRYWLSSFDLERYRPEKFVRVYEGTYGAVFENRHAKPVAYWLEEPAVPLPLAHEPYGVRIVLPTRRQGTLSAHLDLRNMDARAVGADGRATPLTPEPSGSRWMVEVPPGSSAVVFTARESVLLKTLMAGAG